MHFSIHDFKSWKLPIISSFSLSVAFSFISYKTVSSKDLPELMDFISGISIQAGFTVITALLAVLAVFQAIAYSDMKDDSKSKAHRAVKSESFKGVKRNEYRLVCLAGFLIIFTMYAKLFEKVDSPALIISLLGIEVFMISITCFMCIKQVKVLISF